MKHTFTLLFTLFSFYVIAQHFSYFPPSEDQSIYRFLDSYGFSSECTNCIFGYEVNSQEVINGDTIIYHSKIFKGDPEIVGTNEYCVTILDTSWLGVKTIIKANGDYLFFNRHMDTIRLKPYAATNDTWTVFDLGNGDYLEGKVITTNNQNFLGTQDEVKFIRFWAKDVQGNDITTHPFHLKAIQISKNYGVKTGLNFFDFPNDTSEVNLIGQNSLNTNLKHIDKYDIFDFNIGDEFHVHSRTIDFLSYIQENFEKRTVIDYQIDSGDILITYDVERIQLFTTAPPAYDTTYIRDTITTTIWNHSVFSHLDSMPYNFDINNQSSRSELSLVDFENRNYNNRTVKKYDFSTGYHVDTCIHEIIDGFIFPYFYIEGLGGPYKNDFSFNNDSWFRELVYYKKGNETWGDSIHIYALMPTSTRQISVQTLSLSPNPAKNFITLSLNNQIIKDASIEILNADGQLIYQEQVDYLQSNYQVNVNDLTAGFYILRIQNGKNIWMGKFLK